MSKRIDLKTILVIGSGPIVIGQGCEFDYAGTQACLALKEEGYRVILLNSNPATIMTDPKMADATYIEPMTLDVVRQIIEKEKPCAILPTMGGQTALNLTLELGKSGLLSTGIKLLGTSLQTIELAEDRRLFCDVARAIGLDLPKSCIAQNREEAKEGLAALGLPIIVRSSFMLGGGTSSIFHTKEEFFALCEKAFASTPKQKIQFDEALIGWKEFEVEVMRDQNDTCILICSIENIDPLGIHTGDSITVAPAMTLTDKELQKMRDDSFAILRAIGMESGGANVQFAVHPTSGRMVIIEMNPRVSRSSALASKATGFPIAKIATKLAIGYTLDELFCEFSENKIPAAFEPTIDYTVVKLPRFHFEKFKGSKRVLGTQMRSVGEAMAIGRTFSEALLKAMRSLELAFFLTEDIERELKIPGPYRLWAIFDAFRSHHPLQEIQQLTQIDPWFLHQIERLIDAEQMEKPFTKERLYAQKRLGFSDEHIAFCTGQAEEEIRIQRKKWGIIPSYKRVDLCAAEFPTSMAYLYASYEEECEAFPTPRPKILIVGSGPSRIGQGIEFDYSCVHAIQTLKEEGYEALIVNCNPETISTDYTCADKLYLAPLTAEDILDIVDCEKPTGVLLQYGGQTSLNLAEGLMQENVPLLGITHQLIEQTEDRSNFQQFLHRIGLKQPKNRIIHSLNEGRVAAEAIGFPLIVRPSFFLGGQAIAILSHLQELMNFLEEVFSISSKPVLIEHCLSDATEVDVDLVCDGVDVYIPAVLEQIESAGIHSGDSACSIPPFRITAQVQKEIRAQAKKMALALKVVGLMNIQFAIQGDSIYVLEVNPRASRTVPFISKALGIDLVKIATRALLGTSLKEQDIRAKTDPSYFAVKEAVFSFHKFDDVDPKLGPEMKSIGEVMGLGKTFIEAFTKAQIAANNLFLKTPREAVPFYEEELEIKALSSSHLIPLQERF